MTQMAEVVPLKQTITYDQITPWLPCDGYTQRTIKAFMGQRPEMRVRDWLKLSIPIRDRLWVVARPDIIPEDKLRLLCADYAEHVLPVYSKKFPDDKLPHRAVDAARAFVAGAISDSERLQVESDIRSVAKEIATEYPRASNAAWAAAGAVAKEMTSPVVEAVLLSACKASGKRSEHRWQLKKVDHLLIDLGYTESLNEVRKVQLRLAEEKDAPALKRLVEQDGFVFDDWEVDWKSAYPYWLLAEDQGVVLGLLQVLPSRPIGHLEMLVVDPSLQAESRMVVIKALLDQGRAALQVHGAQCISGLIPFDHVSYRKIAYRLGYRTIASGNVMLRRL